MTNSISDFKVGEYTFDSPEELLSALQSGAYTLTKTKVKRKVEIDAWVHKNCDSVLKSGNEPYVSLTPPKYCDGLYVPAKLTYEVEE